MALPARLRAADLGELLQQERGGILNGESAPEAQARRPGKRFPAALIRVDECLQHRRGPFDRVLVYETGAILQDLAPDVHLVADQHWSAGAQGLGDGDSKIFLMRG